MLLWIAGALLATGLAVLGPPAAAGGEPFPSAVIHVVRPGDTLIDIARCYGVTLADLRRANGIAGDLIRPRQRLVIPRGEMQSFARGGFSREDVHLLARLIYAEARGESFVGQVAVGAVVLNRLASPHFPKTIPEIVFQRHQFTPVADGSINLEPDETAFRAALAALNGWDPTNGALYFYNPHLSRDRWIRTLPVVGRIGNHVFATGA